MNNINDSFSYCEFILKLKELGFNITVVGYNDRDYHHKLEMNGFPIAGDKYPLFGRYCGGAYNDCGFSTQNEFTQSDLNEAIKHCSEILMNEIESLNRIPNYHSCKDYLHKYFGKTKIEKESINRVFKILKDNYNDIIRFMQSS